jgi:hypothetical protein
MLDSNEPMSTAERFWRFVHGSTMAAIMAVLMAFAAIGSLYMASPIPLYTWGLIVLVWSPLFLWAGRLFSFPDGKYRRPCDAG